MFKKHWCGDEALSSIDNMRKQLRKNLNDQVNGFWSGRSAYCIMVEGGFLVDEKFKGGKGKRLTAFGEAFVKEFDEGGKTDLKKITETYSRVGIDHTVIHRGEYSYLFIGVRRDLGAMDGGNFRPWNLKDLDRQLMVSPFLEFENGKLVIY